VAWVKVSTLSNGSNTKIGLFYGNSSANTNPSTTNTWDANYAAIWHLSNNNFNDGTANANNGVNSGSTNIAGKIGDGRAFSGSQQITVGHSASINITSNFTFEAWAYRNNSSTYHGIFAKGGFGYLFSVDWPQGSTDNLNCWLNFPGYILYQGGPTALSAWQHLAATFDGSNVRLYIDGSLIATSANTPSSTFQGNTLNLDVGSGHGQGWNGRLDEIRISSTHRSGEWLSTQFNNQNNPGAFYTVGSEQSASALCALLPVELTFFNATVDPDGQQVNLEWSTAQEWNHAGFAVQRSADGSTWAEIAFLQNEGNSIQPKRYRYTDAAPIAPLVYYRLEQHDLDGTTTYSPMRSVSIQGQRAIRVFPNPVAGFLTIESPLPWQVGHLRIWQNGQEIWATPLPEETATHQVSLPDLSPGTYTIEITLDGDMYAVQMIK
jgi:hypothetical protein